MLVDSVRCLLTVYDADTHWSDVGSDHGAHRPHRLLPLHDRTLQRHCQVQDCLLLLLSAGGVSNANGESMFLHIHRCGAVFLLIQAVFVCCEPRLADIYGQKQVRHPLNQLLSCQIRFPGAERPPHTTNLDILLQNGQLPQ